MRDRARDRDRDARCATGGIGRGERLAISGARRSRGDVETAGASSRTADPGSRIARAFDTVPPRRRTDETTGSNWNGTLMIAACGSDSPTTPSSNTGPIMFTAQLSAANEVPPITNADANARGTATITFNVPRDSHRQHHRRRHACNFSAQLTGFPAAPRSNLAHIHTGASGIAGGVLIDTDSAAAQPDHPGRQRHRHAERSTTSRLSQDGRDQHRRKPGRLLLQRAHRTEPGRRRPRSAREAVTDERQEARSGARIDGSTAPAAVSSGSGLSDRTAAHSPTADSTRLPTDY